MKFGWTSNQAAFPPLLFFNRLRFVGNFFDGAGCQFSCFLCSGASRFACFSAEENFVDQSANYAVPAAVARCPLGFLPTDGPTKGLLKLISSFSAYGRYLKDLI